MHSDGGERLWYWTGQRRGGSEIVWWHHGRYDTGQSPAVHFVDEQTVVEVHRSHTRARLFAAVGAGATMEMFNGTKKSNFSMASAQLFEELTMRFS